MRQARQDTSRAVASAVAGSRQCSCGKSLGKLSARDISYEAEAYSEGNKVHMASYVINETFCPACWAVLETRISVPQVEA